MAALTMVRVALGPAVGTRGIAAVGARGIAALDVPGRAVVAVAGDAPVGAGGIAAVDPGPVLADLGASTACARAVGVGGGVAGVVGALEAAAGGDFGDVVAAEELVERDPAGVLAVAARVRRKVVGVVTIEAPAAGDRARVVAIVARPGSGGGGVSVADVKGDVGRRAVARREVYGAGEAAFGPGIRGRARPGGVGTSTLDRLAHVLYVVPPRAGFPVRHSLFCPLSMAYGVS